MQLLTEEQVREGFRLLGLENEEERAKFTIYEEELAPEPRQDFILLDNTTRAPEKDDAELAQPAERD